MEKITLKTTISANDGSIAMSDILSTLINNNNELVNKIEKMEKEIVDLKKDVHMLCENQNCINNNVVINEPSISDKNYSEFIDALCKRMSDKNFRYLNII